MVVFPNCKINLGLQVLHKREDGYHELQTVFYPLPFTDVLEVIRQNNNSTGIELSLSGIEIATSKEKNICIKAYHLLKNKFPDLPSVQMHLHKNIPLGAGLAGGSADSAFALMLFNKEFNLGLTPEKLMNYALQLGSDCPFFIINQPCIATGRGEILQTISLDLSAYTFVLVYPDIHVSTADAFSLMTPHIPQKSITEIIQKPVALWKNELVNDFEIPVFKKHPEIRLIKEQLYKSGAVYASMTGSGSTVYGLFKKEYQIDLKFPKKYFVKILPG